jgi:hypothetical protein
MITASAERVARSHARLTLKWGPALKRWATARRVAWRIGTHCPPLELLARVNALRDGTPWDLLEDSGAGILKMDRLICYLSGCNWEHWQPPTEWGWAREHSLREVVQRATLAVPGVKPARIRHLVARDARAGWLKRTARGRYIIAPREWMWLEPEERFEHDEQEARWEARFEQARKERADVLLLHYLIPQLPVYRKSKAIGISERTYYDRLAHALDCFGMSYQPAQTVTRNVQC